MPSSSQYNGSVEKEVYVEQEQDDQVDQIDIEKSEQFYNTLEPKIEKDVQDDFREFSQNEIEQSARMTLRDRTALKPRCRNEDFVCNWTSNAKNFQRLYLEEIETNGKKPLPM